MSSRKATLRWKIEVRERRNLNLNSIQGITRKEKTCYVDWALGKGKQSSRNSNRPLKFKLDHPARRRKAITLVLESYSNESELRLTLTLTISIKLIIGIIRKLKLKLEQSQCYLLSSQHILDKDSESWSFKRLLREFC